MIRKIVFIGFFILAISLQLLQAQDRIGIYACGVTIHAKGDPNAHLMPLKLSSEGKVIFNYGGVFHYKKYFKSRLSFDAIQSFQADCALQFSSATTVAIGYDIIQKGPHRFLFALGPGFYIRESWEKFDGYQRVNKFKVSNNEKWEYKIIPVVPHIEYAFVPENKCYGFTIYGVLDPVERVYNFGAGINYILK
jgi:hypothetical protein